MALPSEDAEFTLTKSPHPRIKVQPFLSTLTVSHLWRLWGREGLMARIQCYRDVTLHPPASLSLFPSLPHTIPGCHWSTHDHHKRADRPTMVQVNTSLTGRVLSCRFRMRNNWYVLCLNIAGEIKQNRACHLFFFIIFFVLFVTQANRRAATQCLITL